MNTNELFEHILHELSIEAFQCLVRSGVRNLDQFISLNISSIPDLRYDIHTEIINIQANMSAIHQSPPVTLQNEGHSISSDWKYTYRPDHMLTTSQSTQPRSSSILDCSLVDLLCLDEQTLMKLWDIAEITPLTDVITISDFACSRLADLYICPFDTLDTILPLAVGYLMECRVSPLFIKTIYNTLMSKIDVNGIPIDEILFQTASNTPMFEDIDITPIKRFFISNFGLPNELITWANGLQIYTWDDISNLSERDMCKSFDSCMGILNIHNTKCIKSYAVDYITHMPCISDQCYARYNDMVRTFISQAASSERDIDILLRRLGLLDGRVWTLAEVAYHHGVSRERIRQLETKSHKAVLALDFRQNLPLFYIAVSHVMRCGHGVSTLSSMASNLPALMNWDEPPTEEQLYRLLGFAKSLSSDLKSRIIIDACYKCCHCDILLSALQSIYIDNPSQIPVDILVTQLQPICSDCEHKAGRKDDVCPNENMIIYISTLCGSLVRKHRAIRKKCSRVEQVECILHTAERPMHYIEVHKEYMKVWPDDRHMTEHSVQSGILQSRSLIMWGRGTYIHKDYVNVSEDAILAVEQWLVTKLGEGTPFVSVTGAYIRFADMCRLGGIPSDYALYSCLRNSSSNLLTCPRFPQIYLSDGFESRIPGAIAVEQYLRDAATVIKYDELKKYVIDDMGMKEFQFNQLLGQLSSVMRTSGGGFIHSSLLNINWPKLVDLKNYIVEILKTLGHVSVNKIYTQKNISCMMMGIESPETLYSALRVAHENELYMSNYPTIRLVENSQRKSKPLGVISEVISYIREKKGVCGYEELEQHFITKLGYSDRIIYAAPSHPSVVRYGQGSYIHIDTLEWTEARQQLLITDANIILKSAINAGRLYGLISNLLEFGHLPSLSNGIIWTSTLLSQMLAMSKQHLVLGPARNAFVSSCNEHGITSFDDLLYVMLKTNHHGACRFAEFEQELLRDGLIKKQLTSFMLGNNGKVVLIDSIVMIKELAEYAS